MENTMQKQDMQKRIKRRKIDYSIFIIVYILVLIGILMIFSASSVQAKIEKGNSMHFLKMQFIYVILGSFAMFIVSNINYKLYKKFAIPLYVINIGLLIITLIFGTTINDAKRWIVVYGFSFQASEFSKFACIVMTAYLIDKNKNHMKDIKSIIGPLFFVGITFLLIYKQPSFSAGLTIVIVAVVMLFIAGMTWFHTGVLTIGGIIGAFILATVVGYRSDRIEAFLDPFSNTSDRGWQIVNSIYAIASGGIWGSGFGKSTQKYFYISQPQNDFIFAVMAEEFGFVRCLMFIFLYMYLIFRIFRLFVSIKDTFGKMLSAGIGLQIGLQMFMNLGVATGGIPNTGVGLPFISYGGTSVMMFLIMTGVLLNISKYREINRRRGR